MKPAAGAIKAGMLHKPHIRCQLCCRKIGRPYSAAGHDTRTGTRIHAVAFKQKG